MSWIPVSLMLFLLQAPGAQQTPRQQTLPQDRASIQGFILKMGTAEPVSKAVVTLTRTDRLGENFAATTASDGKFLFQSLDPAQYRLSVTRNGYVRSEFGARTPNKPGLPILLSAGQKMTDVVVQMMPAGTIAGRIFDRDGEPLANVNVQALKYSYQTGQKVLNTVQAARTNDLGEYRLFWLPPGQYFVSATYTRGPGGRGPAAAIAQVLGGGGAFGGRPAGPGGRGGGGGPVVVSDQEEEGYIPVYYPGSADAQSAAPINLPAGTLFNGVDLTLSAVRTLRIRGKALNGSTGQPAQNANIMLVPRGRVGLGPALLESFRSRNIDAQGSFEIRGVVPGSYDLVGQVNDRNNPMSGRVPLEIGNSDVENVALVISPGFTITGRLTFETQNAGSKASDVTSIRVNLRPATGGLQFRGGPSNSGVQTDGTFTLQQVGPGDYRVNIANMSRNMYLKVARLGATDVLNEGLHIDRQPSGQLEIVLGTDTGTVDGTVFNDKQEPFANVSVVAVPDPAHRERTDLYRTAVTNAQGVFHMEGVPPGDYKLFAWEDVETGAWMDSEFIRPYEASGKAVRITGSGSANTELRVIPAQ